MTNTLPPETHAPFGAGVHERPVPRISIHAFCEQPETAAAMQRAGGDRRLAKAQLTVQLGGIPSAIEYFQGQVTPNLLLVETHLEGSDAFVALDRLAEVCDPATKVVVVGRTNDVVFYRALMHKGASEYLIGPPDPLHLIEIIASLYADPDGAPLGRMIAFIGARGGAGSSTMAHNAAWFIAEQYRILTTLADFDLPFGTVGLDFNDEPGQGIFEALTAPERLDETLLDRLLAKHGEFLSLFNAPASLDRDFEAGFEAYEAVIDSLRRACPCVIADLPHIWEPWVKAALIGADDIVITACPDLASLRNAKNIVELLRASRPNDPPPKLVLNQVGQPKRPEIPVKDFAETIGFEPAVVIGYDPFAFGMAANNGQMLAETGTKTPAIDAIHAFAARLVGRRPPEHKETKSILSLVKGKSRA
jgi:pilus assembly protein CpaE